MLLLLFNLSNLTETRGHHATIPNFFMRPDEMAESMKALRIAANFRKTPRTSHPSFAVLSSTSDNSEYSPPQSQTEHPATLRNTKVELQEQIRGGVPVDASEMARIASIFTSKNA